MNTRLHPRTRSILPSENAAQLHSCIGMLGRSQQVEKQQLGGVGCLEFWKVFQYSPSWWELLRKCHSPELRRKFLVWINTCLKGEMQGGSGWWVTERSVMLFTGIGVEYVGFYKAPAEEIMNHEVVIFSGKKGSLTRAWRIISDLMKWKKAFMRPIEQ